MIENIPRLSHEKARTSWWPARTSRQQSAAVRLPCGHVLNVGAYDIDRAGYITPEVRCLYPDCEWSGTVQLLGWIQL